MRWRRRDPEWAAEQEVRGFSAEELADTLELVLWDRSGYGRDVEELDGFDVCFVRPGWRRVVARGEVPPGLVAQWDARVAREAEEHGTALVGFTNGAQLRILSMSAMHSLADLPEHVTVEGQARSLSNVTGLPGATPPSAPE